jgi:hypothetical protein
VPFSLLDAIAAHKQRARAFARSRPSTAQRLRRSTADEQDGSASLQSVDCSEPSSSSSSSSALLSGRSAQQRRHRQVEEREASIRALEERQEPEDELLSLRSSQPGRYTHSASVQESVHLLRAAPLLSRLLPAFARIDSSWQSLIAQQQRVRAQEADSMRRLREEEQRWRDAMLLFMRVSVEYRRTELHLPDGRVAAADRQQPSDLAEAEEEAEGVGSDAATRRWLIGDDDQRESMAVDWSGRYWQSERMREKEAWYRLEERQAQSSFQHGLGLLTQLYDRSFQQLLLFADDTKAHGKSERAPTAHQQPAAAASSLATLLVCSDACGAVLLCADDEECQRLRFELQEVLTALSPAAASSTSSASSSPASSEPSPSALLPPRHPSLTAYSDSLHSQLSSLLSLLSSHHHRVFSLIERCHALTRASSSLDDLLSSLHEDERERREEIEQLKQQLADAKDREKQREAEWEERLRTERLEVWKEREQRSRAEQETQALHDTLRRIRSKLESDRRHRQDVKEAETQCEADDTRQHPRGSSGLHLSLPGDEKEPAAAGEGGAGKLRSLVIKPVSSRHQLKLDLSSPPQSPRSPRSAPRSPVSPRSPTGGSIAFGGAAVRGAAASSVAAALAAAASRASSAAATAGGERGEKGRHMAATAARSLTRHGKEAATEGKGKEAESSAPHREAETAAAQSTWSVNVAAAQLTDDKRWDGLPFL